MRNRRRSLLVLLLAPVLLIAGCVSVPMAGPVEQGGAVTDPVDTDFEFLPAGPTPGATQEEILQGFFAATTASQENYRIARSYLSDGISSAWNPYQSTLVRAQEGAVERIDDTTLEYSVQVIAEVDAVGRYRVAPEATDQTLPVFRFAREGGEWRIAELGDGILISQQAFPSAFSQHVLYFYDPTFTNLVPDLRWFPTRAGVPTRIVRALLDGPSSWLDQGATVSAIPEGVQLVAAPVGIVDGQAVVDLSSEILELGDAERQRLLAQFRASFGSLGNVAGVQLTVDQTPVSIPTTTALPEVNPQVDGRLLLMGPDGDRFGFSSGGATVEPVGRLSERAVELGAQALTLGPSRTVGAMLTDEGAWVVRSNDLEPLLLDQRAGLVPPSFDGFQLMWSATSDAAAGLTAITTAGEVLPVDVVLPEGTRLVSIDVSRDDARILIMLQGESGPRLVVGAIARDEASGRPIRIGDLLDIPIEGATGATALDAAWVDEVRVASVVETSQGTAVDLHEIGGRSRSLG
ncbi:MAG: GerMN domain-containing protein, partial [Microcella sp.]